MLAAPPFLQLVRPRQFYKNLIVLAPLLFSGHVLDPHAWPLALACLLAFVVLSGATYAANDVLDVAADRAHPEKRNRPVASGRIQPTTAVAFAMLLAVLGLMLLASLDRAALLLGVAYLVLQTAYNLALKQLLLWDVLAIAIGFVLRALAGTVVLGVGAPTVWLIVCTFLFALHLALAKRRRELIVLGDRDDAATHRTTLGDYTVPFVEQCMQSSTAILLVAYALYAATGGDPAMLATLPFAFYGVLRLNWLVHRAGPGDETDVMLRDRPLLWNAMAWILAVALVRFKAADHLAQAFQFGGA